MEPKRSILDRISGFFGRKDNGNLATRSAQPFNSQNSTRQLQRQFASKSPLSTGISREVLNTNTQPSIKVVVTKNDTDTYTIEIVYGQLNYTIDSYNPKKRLELFESSSKVCTESEMTNVLRELEKTLPTDIFNSYMSIVQDKIKNITNHLNSDDVNKIKGYTGILSLFDTDTVNTLQTQFTTAFHNTVIPVDINLIKKIDTWLFKEISQITKGIVCNENNKLSKEIIKYETSHAIKSMEVLSKLSNKEILEQQDIPTILDILIYERYNTYPSFVLKKKKQGNLMLL